jgi:hypothetical protein
LHRGDFFDDRVDFALSGSVNIKIAAKTQRNGCKVRGLEVRNLVVYIVWVGIFFGPAGGECLVLLGGRGRWCRES